MQLVYFHTSAACRKDELLRRLFLSNPLGKVIKGLAGELSVFKSWGDYRLIVPNNWQACARVQSSHIVAVSQVDSLNLPEDDSYYLLINGNVITDIDSRLLKRWTCVFEPDVLSITVSPSLAAYQETARITSDNRLVGLSRHYGDAVEPYAAAEEWPHYMLIHRRHLSSGQLRDAFSKPFNQWLSGMANVKQIHLRMGGRCLDMEKAGDFMEILSCVKPASLMADGLNGVSVRVCGSVFAGRDIYIGSGAVLLGPVVLCNGSKIGQGAIIQNAVIGTGVEIAPGQKVQNQIIFQSQNTQEMEHLPSQIRSGPFFFSPSAVTSFRFWSPWSYPQCCKRIGDFVAAIIVLILCIPIFLVVAAAIKLTSSGPIFYRARRQGLHGREFDCLKFRTMIAQADTLQDYLREVNQVDGPQFKMDNDPRISPLGKFLRDTCIDELPQFINVLLGQMSLVGPRPSPESENQSAPSWRDARLSVRPGITGLWQVQRTRREGMDFQEWIYYDLEYVRKLSFKLDMWICIKTVQHITMQLLKHF